MPIERKLAAIMFTDIVGYTALSAKDSTKSSELLKTQRELLKPIVEKHGGSWMKEMGDGLLLTFDSATSAVECSIAIQKSTKEIDGLNLRIGIHEGEVIKQDGDVLGDDVNVAARIEPFSAEGGVAISQKVQQAISSNKEFETKFIGTPKLKGVAQDVKVYCITSHELPETDVSKVSAKLEKKTKFNFITLVSVTCILITILLFVVFKNTNDHKIPSIAIVPFVNKGKSEDLFYSYGISSDILMQIRNIGSFKVKSSNDIEKLNIKDLTNQEISQALSIKYLVNGSLWKKNNTFQIVFEVYDSESNDVILNHRFEKDSKDLSEISSIITNKILKEFNVQLNTSYYASNSKAYEYFLKGRYKYDTWKTQRDIDEAIIMLEKAIEIDAQMPSPHITLGWIYYSEKRDYNKAFKYYSEANILSKKYNLNWESGWSTLYLGDIKSMRDKDTYAAISYWNEALEIFNKINSDYGKLAVYGNLTSTYIYEKYKLEKANEFLKKASDILRKLDYKDQHPDISYRLANFNFMIGNFNESQKLLNQCIDLSKLQNNDSYFAHCTYRYGIQSIYNQDYQKAIKSFSITDSLYKQLYTSYDKSDSLYYNTLIQLCNYQIAIDNKEINIDDEILKYIADYYEDFDYEDLYTFYILTKQKSLLMDAYLLLNDFIETLDKNQITGFISLYYPKMIINEYTKLNSTP